MMRSLYPATLSGAPRARVVKHVACVMEEPLVASSSGRLHKGKQGALLERSFGGSSFSGAASHAQSRQKLQRIYATKQERRREGSVKGGEQEVDSNFFSNLVSTLLFGAASRIERGTSVCVSCRGTGTITCKECQASGVTKASSTRSSSSSSSLKAFVGTKSKEKEWIVSNRCRNCKGHGRLECPNCNGEGRRFSQSSDL